MFISHGTKDQVLEIGRTSRTVVPQLGRAGYDVIYREFAEDTVQPEIAREALDWFVSANVEDGAAATPAASRAP